MSHSLLISKFYTTTFKDVQDFLISLLVSDFQKSSLHPTALLELRRHWFYKICCPFFLSSLCLLLLFQYFLCSQSWTLRMIHVSVVVHFPVDLQPTEMVPASHQGNWCILTTSNYVLRTEVSGNFNIHGTRYF